MFNIFSQCILEMRMLLLKITKRSILKAGEVTRDNKKIFSWCLLLSAVLTCFLIIESKKILSSRY